MKIKKESLEYTLDFIGILASLACAIHCLALPFVLTISALGNLMWLNTSQLEWSFIVFTILIAASSLLWSFFWKHRKSQVLWLAVLGVSLIIGNHIEHTVNDYWLTAFGGILLASAHALNWLFLQKKFRYAISKGQLLALSFTVMALLTYKFTKSEVPANKEPKELLELVWEVK